jgi:membrane protein
MGPRFSAAEEHVASLWNRGGLTWRELLHNVWGGIRQNDLIDRAYELAFNFLLAVFPLLLLIVASLDIFATQGTAMRNALYHSIAVVLPPDASALVISTLQQVTHNQHESEAGKLAFGVLFWLFAGSSGMTQLMSTLNAAYEVPEKRSWIRVHLISIGLTLAMSVLIIVSLLLILFGADAVARLSEQLALPTMVFVSIKVVEWILALGFVIFAFANIYYFAADVDQNRWYWITPGSCVGVVLWVLASIGLRIYLHYFNSYSATYGSLGAVIVLMLWFYATGLAMLIGGQINATIEHAAALHGDREAKLTGHKVAESATPVRSRIR